MSFGVRHFAGPVEYDVKEFYDRNNDSLSSDFVTLFRGNGTDIIPTSNNFIQALFSSASLSTEHNARNSNILTSAHVSKIPLRHPSLKRKQVSDNNPSLTAESSIGNAFKYSLDEMVATISETVPWFVFCLKPNEDLVSTYFTTHRILLFIKDRQCTG